MWIPIFPSPIKVNKLLIYKYHLENFCSVTTWNSLMEWNHLHSWNLETYCSHGPSMIKRCWPSGTNIENRSLLKSWECAVKESLLTAAAKSLQLCPTLCHPSPGILQARTLEWVAISFSSAWKWKVKVKSLSHVWLFVIPWTAAHQAPPSMGFSRQEYWSGVPLPSP